MKLRLSVLSVCLVSCACASKATGEGEESAGEESSGAEMGEGGEEQGESDTGEAPFSDELVGDHCEVEVLWETRDFELTDMTIDSEGAFVLAGMHTGGEGSAQATLRVAGGELEWSALYEPVEQLNVAGPRSVSVVEGPAGELWVFGTHRNVGESFILAYGKDGELRWEQRSFGWMWRAAAAEGDAVFAWTRQESTGVPALHRFDAQGDSLWSFAFDASTPGVNAAAARDGQVWGAGYIGLDCAWWGRWSAAGELQASDCPAAQEQGEDAWSVLPFADGSFLLGGGQYLNKATDTGVSSYTEPLIMHLDANGEELSRWHYGPELYWGGWFVDMAELPAGGIVGVSEEQDIAADIDYESPTIHRFDADARHVARCELDRTAIPNYYGRFIRVSVAADGAVYALMVEGRVTSSNPLDDESEFPPVPEDFAKTLLVRIDGL